jgi:hypothetical protein
MFSDYGRGVMTAREYPTKLAKALGVKVMELLK